MEIDGHYLGNLCETGIDTRCLTKKIREKGTMLGKLVVDGTPETTIPFDNPNQRNMVKEVSVKVKLHQRWTAQVQKGKIQTKILFQLVVTLYATQLVG